MSCNNPKCGRLFDTDPRPELVFGKGHCPHCGEREATYYKSVSVTVYD